MGSGITQFPAVPSGATPRWVSGTNYALDDDVWSPTSGHIYRCIVAGAGTTDPSADQTNWKLVGAGGIKSIQRGTVSAMPNGITVAIAAVDVAKTEVRNLGVVVPTSNSPGIGDLAFSLVLTSSTTLFVKNSSGGNTNGACSWEITERW